MEEKREKNQIIIQYTLIIQQSITLYFMEIKLHKHE